MDRPVDSARVALPDGLILGIENSNPDRGRGGFHGEVALGERKPGALRPLARERLRPESERDDDVMASIDRAFRSAGRSPRDLRGVAVSIGPGGFTGLRISTVTAKALCEATGAACFAVPTADALARRVGADRRTSGPVAVCLAWKNDTVWRAVFRPGPVCDEAGLVRFDRVFQARPGETAAQWTLVADARCVEAMRKSVRLPEGVGIVAPEYDAFAVIEAAEALTPTDPVALGPLYPREPEAVTKWRELHPPRGG